MFIKLALICCVVVICLAEGGSYGHGGSSYSSILISHDNGHHQGHAHDHYDHEHEHKYHGHAEVHHDHVHQKHGHDHDHHVDYYAHPKYKFKYGVSDDHTHDHHSQQESRDGDVVHGEYSLHEADGTIRTVKYTADHENGFNAEVIREGHAKHPKTDVKHAFVAHHDDHGHAHY